nr:hypothetical protein [Clavibacter michiganensis]
MAPPGRVGGGVLVHGDEAVEEVLHGSAIRVAHARDHLLDAGDDRHHGRVRRLGRAVGGGDDELAAVARMPLAVRVPGGLQPVEHEAHGGGRDAEPAGELGRRRGTGGDEVVHRGEAHGVDGEGALDAALERLLRERDAAEARADAVAEGREVGRGGGRSLGFGIRLPGGHASMIVR